MKKTFSNWIDYWNNDKLFTKLKLKKCMEIFIKSSMPIMNYNQNDILLDIGCGPGYLADWLKNSVKEIHCLDTSERYLEICKSKFNENSNVFVYKVNPHNYTKIPFLKEKNFTKIICLSVIQYYKSLLEIEEIIQEVKRVAAADAKFLIADIQTSNNSKEELLTMLKVSFKGKYLWETLNFMIKARFSEYWKMRSALGFLILSEADLIKIIEKLNLDAEILSLPLTEMKNRKHLLINF